MEEREIKELVIYHITQQIYYHPIQKIENRYSGKYLYRNIHKSTIHSKQEVKAIQESFGGRMNEQNVIYMMKYNSALTRKEILSQATTWMNLEDIILS